MRFCVLLCVCFCVQSVFCQFGFFSRRDEQRPLTTLTQGLFPNIKRVGDKLSSFLNPNHRDGVVNDYATTQNIPYDRPMMFPGPVLYPSLNGQNFVQMDQLYTTEISREPNQANHYYEQTTQNFATMMMVFPTEETKAILAESDQTNNFNNETPIIQNENGIPNPDKISSGGNSNIYSLNQDTGGNHQGLINQPDQLYTTEIASQPNQADGSHEQKSQNYTNTQNYKDNGNTHLSNKHSGSNNQGLIENQPNLANHVQNGNGFITTGKHQDENNHNQGQLAQNNPANSITTELPKFTEGVKHNEGSAIRPETGLQMTPPLSPDSRNFEFAPSRVFAETCTTVENEIGSCLMVERCEPYLRLIKEQGTNPIIVNLLRRAHCGFDGNKPKVCCPRPGLPSQPEPSTTTTTTTTTTSTTTSTTTTTTEAPAQQPSQKSMSGNYVPALPEPPVCGVSNASFSRVVGGVDAKLGDFPWMALLGYKGRNNGPTRWLCGGSLISSKHILTASHCIHNHEEDLYVIRLGELDLAREDDGATPVDVLIKEMIKHEDYSPNAYTNDIAILVLDTEVQFTDMIKPICIPKDKELRSNTFVDYKPLIAGWGDTEFRGPAASHLQVLQLPVVTNDFCKKAYSMFKKQVIDERVLCAGFKEGGKDACQGDSGGPLMQPIYNHVTYTTFFYQTGVVSFGKKCAEAGFPGVYSRVTHFVPWILSKVVGS